MGEGASRAGAHLPPCSTSSIAPPTGPTAPARANPVSAPRRSLPPSKVRTMARPRGLSHISASSSSDNSSFGGFSSSSEPDSSASRRARIRPIRTLPPPPPPRPTQRAASPPEKHHRGRARSFSIRSRLRDLARSKAPSSPGSRFVSLLNSLFANAAGKQRKSKPSTVDDSACHAAPTRSRPCLVKTPLSRKGHDEGVKRSVRFHPVCVIMGEEVLPRSKNIPYAGERVAAARAEDQRRPAAVAEGIAREEARRKVEKLLRSLEVEEEVNEDEMSDSSSDLFELESLTINGDGGGYRDELPVYKTTHPGTAFSRGLVQ
ncbi:hypothetical protein ZIOFF_073640 [Zingiber officinale]|uniref:Uncharacterized protein n=1 Tax=Zingiber officinale TaxID=94328 RepID=A0A8J5EAE3_ZINOF|nr:hypothetical protein ZIOFF_073640 [Zingiber officinale]